LCRGLAPPGYRTCSAHLLQSRPSACDPTRRLCDGPLNAAGEMKWVRLVRKISVNSVPHPVSHGTPWDNGMGHPTPANGEWRIANSETGWVEGTVFTVLLITQTDRFLS
jgi:hypothetical protein